MYLLTWCEYHIPEMAYSGSGAKKRIKAISTSKRIPGIGSVLGGYVLRAVLYWPKRGPKRGQKGSEAL